MNRDDDNSFLPPGRSWRHIRQEVKPLTLSRQGRRRRLAVWFKAGALTALVAGLGWVAFAVTQSWASDRAALATAVHSEPVRAVVLLTDGVLTHDWAVQVLALPKSASLMVLDLPALRDRLLVHRQVREAVLTRDFPDRLVVTLQERTPVARVQASDGSGAPQQLMVAKDGVVYGGLNYAKPMLASLPWLDGIRLVKSGPGYAPVAGMAEVSALLSTAQLQAPHLYREWLIVSLERLAARDEIVVKAQDVAEIIFSRRRDFYKQVAQLDYIIDRAQEALPASALLSVNLSLDGQVPVRLQGTPDELAAAPLPFISLQPSPRKTKRDL